jgi:hypothetical protein
VIRKPAAVLLVLSLAVLALALIPAVGLAKGGGGSAKPGGGGGGKPGGGSCTQKAPGVAVDNNWAWGATGSYGMPGQQLTYAIDVINYDAGCGSSSFVVSVTAPDGFDVSVPTSTVSLKSASSAYIFAYVTSPAVADGDYPITVSVQRTGSSELAVSDTSYYKVYSADTLAPTLFWENPSDGATVTGRSYNVSVTSNDDHAVKRVDIYIDGAFKAASTCDNVTYNCTAYFTWPTVPGAHTATFTSCDWMGNVGSRTVTFTVS